MMGGPSLESLLILHCMEAKYHQISCACAKACTDTTDHSRDEISTGEGPSGFHQLLTALLHLPCCKELVLYSMNVLARRTS